jgi:Domain of unknown function (DUF222)
VLREVSALPAGRGASADRATIDAVFAKLAAPGMCNPVDSRPVVAGQPSPAAIDGDTRSAAQRQHDALNAECKI